MSYYLNGILSNAVTRGDGNIGEIVTENIKTIKDIPHKLIYHYPKFIEIRGEIFMKKSDFYVLNEIQEKKGCISAVVPCILPFINKIHGFVVENVDNVERENYEDVNIQKYKNTKTPGLV